VFCPRHTKKGPRFVEHVAQAIEPAVQSDEVEEIAMLAGCGIGLMFNCT
jgi:hypothetical protein